MKRRCSHLKLRTGERDGGGAGGGGDVAFFLGVGGGERDAFASTVLALFGAVAFAGASDGVASANATGPTYVTMFRSCTDAPNDAFATFCRFELAMVLLL